MMNRKPLVVLLLMVLLGGAWWMLFISPRNADIGRLEAELEAAVDEEIRLRLQIRALEEVLEHEVEYLLAIDTLEGLIPDVPGLDTLIEQIHERSLESGIELLAMTSAQPAQMGTADLREIRVSLRLEGEFFELIGFLFALNDLERLVRVDTVAISSGEDDLGRTTLGITLQIRAFTLAALLPEVIEPLPPIDDPFGEDDETTTPDPIGPEEPPGGDA